ncbi:uncharacterized protein HMPREF1541_10398 [Cyphellophora europaea CBS 101466]|uniref:Glycosyltransferase family 25 protein n=1 Tax=Cyphellophora europaea (strain CBS 101466) TaxID=1220924 RepID=W2S9L3_CYPE1|nr:uncharacterized protein HMPREF1541_10398 [Cyphellophora europaea CBS 101466]ETN44728.1 hypothetical protein HMPREF1541_10398 [Cyphellophora europaea CBS 101466]
MPPDHNDEQPSGVIGAWQSHVKALRDIVQHNISTALIFEDDIDWDIRLKSQLQNFAVASDAFLGSQDRAGDIPITLLPSRQHVPTMSPYGDGWDILWLGHCEQYILDEGPHIIQTDDPTAAAVKHNFFWDGFHPSDMKAYPDHSRAVFRSRQGVCSFAYAVSQKGAQKLLYQMSQNDFSAAYDLMLSKFCDGSQSEEKRGPRMCLSVLPTLFDTYLPRGDMHGDSEINGNVQGHRDQGWSPSIRWSVRVNMERLLEGGDVVDQWPDDRVRD